MPPLATAALLSQWVSGLTPFPGPTTSDLFMTIDNQRRYLARLSAAAPASLIDAIRHATPEQELALRTTLGGRQWEELASLASSEFRGPAASQGNVVLLPGIMGSELTAFDGSDPDLIWASVWRFIFGAFTRLPLDPATGLSVHDVRPSGIMLRYYAKQIVSLSRAWNVRPFFFDWRRDIRVTAAGLHQSILDWFGPGAPVHLVAHSMGGLVARSFIARYPDHWAGMADADGLRRGGRLIMLGTPNYGSFSIPQLLSGENSVLQLISNIDLEHSLDDLMRVAATFPGVYQMLPALGRLPGLDPLYRASTYTRIPVSQPLIDGALHFQRELAAAVDPSRMIYVAGYNRPTASGLAELNQLGSNAGYVFTNLGDGTVPHNLGLLGGVPAFFVDCDHQGLPQFPEVLGKMDEFLSTGIRQNEAKPPSAAPAGALPEAAGAAHQARIGRIASLVSSLRRRGGPEAGPLSPEEPEIVDLILQRDNPPPEPAESSGPAIKISVIECPVEQVAPASLSGLPPIDAIAVGHYLGVRPSGAERDLDLALSAPGEPLLAQFHARGVLRGELGETFLLPDPRPSHAGVVLAIAGMGRIGGFGAPELSVLARGLCWTLARLGKRHLAAPLIGAGQDNLSTVEAARAWLSGLRRALAEPNAGLLTAVTFTVLPGHAGRLGSALRAAAAELGGNFDLSGVPHPSTPLQPEIHREPAATRLSVEFADGLCRCGVIGDNASIPERAVALNARRVEQINDALLRESDPARRHRLGRFLFDFLFPRDFLAAFPGSAPLVITCNSDAARVYWELAAPPSGIGEADSPLDGFLGLNRALTRQLRTSFAPPPEALPPSGGPLRVLLVADGASERPLPGARDEAARLLALFEDLNRGAAAPLISCTPLIGPREATALNVLLALDNDPPYDVLHYAGHCLFDAAAPSRSGFLFSGGDVLNASDLGRLDRVPRFVFANACRSGELAPEAVESAAGMAPSFAAEFFNRGVANFVCTAWPIDDSAASHFAASLYASLLGAAAAPAPMWQAMRDARRAIAASLSWPAYQHYGDPYFRLAGSDREAA